ncbi:MAG: Rieske 2Fe-2S domain-containing protein [Candidatus Eremiobacteraeota bacterium]|nr:Rieske 2Fe-2S domain-containing protein [Candidatus Eremiobacteraeota bacterium]
MTQQRNGVAFVRLAPREAVAPDRAFVGRVGDYEVAVFDLGDALVAYENVCPHQGGPIGEGIVDGATVTCPWHAWCFDLRTGSMSIGDFARLRRFAVFADHEGLFISVQPVEGPP